MGNYGSSVALFLPGGEGSEHGRSGSVDRLQPCLSSRRPPIHASPRSLQPTHLLPELHQTPQPGSDQFHLSDLFSFNHTHRSFCSCSAFVTEFGFFRNRKRVSLIFLKRGFSALISGFLCIRGWRLWIRMRWLSPRRFLTG